MANKFGMVFEDYTSGVFVYNENNNHYLGQIKGKTSNEVSKMRFVDISIYYCLIERCCEISFYFLYRY